MNYILSYNGDNMAIYRVENEKEHTVNVWTFDSYTDASRAYREILTTAEGISLKLIEYSEKGAITLLSHPLRGAVE